MPIRTAQFQLILAAPPGNAEQARTIHQSGFFGVGGVKTQGAQRTQQQIADTGIPTDDVQRVASLRHGPLAQYLARRDEARPVAVHAFPRPAHHEYLAVHAGVEHAAVAVDRPGSQQAA